MGGAGGKTGRRGSTHLAPAVQLTWQWCLISHSAYPELNKQHQTASRLDLGEGKVGRGWGGV